MINNKNSQLSSVKLTNTKKSLFMRLRREGVVAKLVVRELLDLYPFPLHSLQKVKGKKE